MPKTKTFRAWARPVPGRPRPMEDYDGRMAERDYVDNALLRRRYTKERLFELAAERGLAWDHPTTPTPPSTWTSGSKTASSPLTWPPGRTPPRCGPPSLTGPATLVKTSNRGGCGIPYRRGSGPVAKRRRQARPGRRSALPGRAVLSYDMPNDKIAVTRHADWHGTAEAADLLLDISAMSMEN